MLATLVACAPTAPTGPEVALDLHTRGGRVGRYIVRVFRADGPVVAEQTADASRAGTGERLRVTLPCDPTRAAQPNRIELSFDPPALDHLVPIPDPVIIPFGCDATLVELRHELIFATAQGDTFTIGDATCQVEHGFIAPALGGFYRVAQEVRCEGPAGVAIARDPPTLLCADETLALPAEPADHVATAFPWADVAIAEAPEDRRFDAALEPLLGVDCALVTTLHVREQDSSGTRPTLTLRTDRAGTPPTVSYAPAPQLPPPVAAPPTATATWDGAALDLALPLPRGRTPASGLHLAATTDDGAHAWSIYVSEREATALRDDALTPVTAAIDADGVLRLRLPAGPGAAVITPLRHSDGPLGRPVAWDADLQAHDDNTSVTLTPTLTELRPLLGLPSPPTAGTPVRLEGLFPAPVAVRIGPITPSVAQTADALAFTWPADAPANAAVTIDASWAPLAPTKCDDAGLCLTPVTTPATRTGRYLTAPVLVATHEVDAALVARALDGDPALGVTPLRAGPALIAAFATGRATCLAIRGDDAPLALFAGDADARPLRADTPGQGTDRYGCVPGSVTVTAAAGTSAISPAVDVRTSAAGVVLAAPADGPRLLTFTAASDGVDVRVAGFSAPLTELTLHLGALALPLALGDDGTWSATLPATARSGFATVTAADGAATRPVWVALRGADSDGDGVDDANDACPRVADPDQEDADGDGRGDVCDPDPDGDGWDDRVDRCPDVWDPDQADTDGDGAGDACDWAPLDPAEQRDDDGDGIGDNAQYAGCGDGRIEPAAGEQCDDGNRVPHDGCEPDCRLPCAADVGAVRAVFDSRTGHCIFALSGSATYDDAIARCAAAGGHPVIPDDDAEQLAAYQVARFRADATWIGVDDRQVERTFRTLAGVEPTYTPWGPNEPTSDVPFFSGNLSEVEDCVAIERAIPTWQDRPCSDTLTVVCERAAAPCGDGVPMHAAGEACDDGNLIADDGCDPDCTLSCQVFDRALEPSPPAADVHRARRDPVSGHCLADLEPRGWLAARARCDQLGGYLWVPDDDAEDDLGDTFLTRGGWLGIQDAGAVGDYRTETGRPVPPTPPWAPEDVPDPERRCVHRGSDGLWRVEECDAELPFACEIPANGWCGDGAIERTRGETCDPGDGTLARSCGPECQTDFLGEGVAAGVRREQDGHWLVALATPAPAATAMERCEALGGYLVVSGDPDEEALAIALAPGWRGVTANHEPGRWLTPQGDDARFIPDGAYAVGLPGLHTPRVASTGALRWAPGEPTAAYPIVCEIEPQSCGDGVVQVALGEACDGEGRGCGPGCSAACDVDAPFAVRSPTTGRCIIGASAPGATAATAAALCAELDAVPYAPLSVDEDRIAADFGRRAWLGVGDADSEGVYVDATGAPIALAFWDVGQPNDTGAADCVVMEAAGAWNDVACDASVDAVLCARAPAECGDARLDSGEPCDDGDDCDCPLTCAAELAPKASYLELGAQCLWTTAPALDRAAAAAVCEAGGGHLARADDPWRKQLAGRLGGGWVAGGCARVDAAGALLPDDCDALASAVCERAPQHCGDGVVQASLGETCDDKNTTDADGCDDDCTLPCGAAAGATAALRSPGGTCFFRLFGLADYAQATTLCATAGGHLPVPLDAADNAALAHLGVTWLGISDAQHEGAFVTVLDPPTFFAWSHGAPGGDADNEDCVALVSPYTAAWDDVRCTLLLPVSCQAPP